MNAYVLAGGASRRMGVDKARLPQRGWTMAAWMCDLLEETGLRPYLVRRELDGLPWPRPDGRSVEVLVERAAPDRHPLHGVVAALEHAGGDALIAPCDLPGLTADAARALAERPCAAAGHPLLAHLPFDRLGEARALVARGGAARELVAGLPVVALPPGALVDRNDGGGPWPIQGLRERFAWLGDGALHALLAGERARQLARGVLDPSWTEGPDLR